MRFLYLSAAAVMARAAGISAVPMDDTTTLTGAEPRNGAVLEDQNSPVLCNDKRWGSAGYRTIGDGIAYLRGVSRRGGKCSTAARNCNRVSCSWNSAIYVCNDRDAHIDPSCDVVADYAQAILDACGRYHHGRHHVKGQRFNDAAGWNIVVHSASC